MPKSDPRLKKMVREKEEEHQLHPDELSIGRQRRMGNYTTPDPEHTTWGNDPVRDDEIAVDRKSFTRRGFSPDGG